MLRSSIGLRLVVVIAVVALFVFLLRDSKSWSEKPLLRDGSEMLVHQSRTGWRSCGVRHGPSVGGGGDRLKVELQLNGKSYRWHADYDCPPFIFGAQSDRVYLACFDRTHASPGRFELYAGHEGTLEKVDRKDFPRDVVQNSWMGHLAKSERQALETLDAGALRLSLTAKLWRYLETGEQADGEPVAEEFIDAYKARYFAELP